MRALLGGTFNPPHQGHINAGLEAITAIGVDRLGLLPCKLPPHKTAPQTDTQHRLAMLELECENEPRLYVEPLELSLPAPSYTLKTLQHLRTRYGDAPLFFLLGEDSLYNLPSWYQWQSLTDYCHIVVMRRPASPGKPDEQLQAWLDTHKSDQLADFHRLPAGLVYITESQDYAVSSTLLRNALATNQTSSSVVTDWLNPAVLHYIKQHELYGTTGVSEETFCNTSS
ncbi:nicotinate-nucleotide adenylyltransferase [Alteromonas lipolytica]|uniref:Probable nicotinate-nucleotide adenylyltransferase n=1 Tax=Alteromonas lipolytica TaxID=1856405 RepID=A0A1E8FGF9_9ALTE|nr:nicotinate-nucleotide adenylyltransferase [Alteromonas lipolytica]OFI35032.1 nicotinate (nicotinamide) nucleotide adenylyltransferase [Alteromonas lipolytica]GGF56048.1 putative nicotinate-nucleotide adenylyltransferase [Alteromonas lipolytica]